MASPMSAMVAVRPSQLPVSLSIGTRPASDEDHAYNYVYVDGINMYVCDHQTITNVPGEVLAVATGLDEHMTTWYVAQEGVVIDGQRFEARRCVFRTTERFWEPGRHEWQLNVNSSSTNSDDSSWSGTMFAWTEVPDNVDVISVTVGLQFVDARDD